MTLLNDLISYWKFDSNSTTQIDSHASNDLEVTGAAFSSGNGILNSTYDYEGNDYIQRSGALVTGSNSFSVSLWVYCTQSDNWRTMFSLGSATTNGALMITTDGANTDRTLSIARYGVSAFLDSVGALALNGWTHVVFTYNGSTAKIYINGSLDNTATSITLSIASSSDYTIFGSTPAHNQNWDGRIDECGLWSRDLTADEVSSLYNSGSALSYDSFTGDDTGLQVNIGDAWKSVDAVQINIGDSWKSVAGMKVNIGDSWKTIF